ncbi:MAG TPA: patatin-like phospholipase family protein [Pseudoxanthomonas sp.]|nr:patatin-like phospholipase family protein [Pseudoxanthomonas sp.]
MDMQELTREELKLILGKAKVNEAHERALWGLALSGGGIRSATYGLGVLQALAKSGWLSAFHYLSTVSGGGYIGSFVQSLMCKTGGIQEASDVLKNEPPSGTHVPQPEAGNRITHLRRHSNYLSPRKATLSLDSLSIVSTYLTNLALIQVQLLSLLVCVFLYALLLLKGAGWLLSMYAVEVFVGLLLVVAGATVMRLQDSAAVERSLEAFSAFLLVGAVAGTCIVAAFLLRSHYSRDLLTGIAVVHGVLLASWGLVQSLHAKGGALGAASRIVAAAISAGVLWLCLFTLNYSGVLITSDWNLLGYGGLLVCVAYALASVAYVGLSSYCASEIERERHARYLSRLTRWLLATSTLPMVIAFYLPTLVLHYLKRLLNDPTAADFVIKIGLPAMAVVAICLLSKPLRHLLGLEKLEFAKALLLPALIFTILLIVAVGIHATSGMNDWDGCCQAATYHCAASQIWIYLASKADTLMWVALAANLIWLLFALFVDENTFSMSAFYRGRLVRCYMEEPSSANIDQPNCDPPLAELATPQKQGQERPLYPLIGTAVNLSSGPRLDWQDRQAASFLLSPLYCGHVPLEGSDPRIGDAQALPSRIAKQLTVGTATAISGAAVSSTMGYHNRPGLAFLMTLFNMRLGWWLTNHARIEERKKHRRHVQYLLGLVISRFPGLNLACEMLGLTWGSSNAIHLSDGGHFENLGIYELLRRKCRFIVCVDATADPERTFFDLGNAVHKARVDLNINIDIDVSKLRLDPATRLSRRNTALGKIHYPGDLEASGLLLYIKPSLIGEETADVQRYAADNPSFPHEATVNQFYCEDQFESYRQLGFTNTFNLLDNNSRLLKQRAPVATTVPNGVLTLSDFARKEKILLSLQHWLYEPVDAVRLHASKHSQTLAALFAKLARCPELAVLDAQLQPAWLYTRPADPAQAHTVKLKEMPKPEQFRANYYFCEELLQHMESVFNDLDLGRNWNHPDNRGWMNLFHHWTWVPMFRLTWALTFSTHGSRFTRFCESRLGLPTMVEAARTAWHCLSLNAPTRYRPAKLGTSTEILEWAKRAAHLGEISFAEERRLAAAVEHRMPITGAHLATYACLHMQLDWGVLNTGRSFLEAGQMPRPMPAGIALVDLRTAEIILFRIQDHLRKLGLGAHFMRDLVERYQRFPIPDQCRPLRVNLETINRLGGDRRIVDADADAHRRAIRELFLEATLATQTG